MKSKKVLILAVIFALLTSIFAMSNDSVDEPKVAKKEVKQEIVQVDRQVTENKTEQSKSNETVKDRLGFDTGMTKEELLKFETEYYRKCRELGIKKGRRIGPGSYYKHRVNINAAEELKEMGLLLTKDPFSTQEIFAYDVINCDVILIGTIENIEYRYETEEEERKTKDARSKYTMKVEEVLKGKELFDEIPAKIHYWNMIGRFVNVSNDQKQEIGKKYILYFNKWKGNDIDLQRVGHSSSLLIQGNELHFIDVSPNSKYFKTFNSAKEVIKKFDNLNSAKNFYDEHYMINGRKK